MNILILSCGSRNKIIQYFKHVLHPKDGRVIAADCSRISSAIYEADRYYIVPRISDEKYIDFVFEICRKENVKGVLSLIDTELSLLAKHEDNFDSMNVKVIGSNYELCERSLNKYTMFQWLEGHSYRCAKSYIDIKEFYHALEKKEIYFPVFMKPVKGSASLSISKVMDKEQAEFLYSKGFMVQEYLDGQEIGVDVYVDLLSRKVVYIFAKKKIAMRAGETEKSVSFKDKKLFDLIEDFVLKSGFLGQLDIDVFEIEGEYYISEVNPRFGGGYPHAYECGCDSISAVINNLEGIENKRCIGGYDEGVYMIKYNEILVRKIG